MSAGEIARLTFEFSARRVHFEVRSTGDDPKAQAKAWYVHFEGGAITFHRQADPNTRPFRIYFKVVE